MSMKEKQRKALPVKGGQMISFETVEKIWIALLFFTHCIF